MGGEKERFCAVVEVGARVALRRWRQRAQDTLPSTMNATSNSAEAMTEAVSLMYTALELAEQTFHKLPGSSVLTRYVKSSHRDDPGRTILEILLFLFVVRTWLQSRTRTERAGKHFIQFSSKVGGALAGTVLARSALTRALQEIDDLVDEWVPEPLCEALNENEQAELAAVPVIVGAQGPRVKLAHTGKTTLNLASFNFTGLAGNEACRQRALETLRTYGVGSCGPAGFYGTLGPCLLTPVRPQPLTPTQTSTSRWSATSPTSSGPRRPSSTRRATARSRP